MPYCYLDPLGLKQVVAAAKTLLCKPDVKAPKLSWLRGASMATLKGLTEASGKVPQPSTQKPRSVPTPMYLSSGGCGLYLIVFGMPKTILRGYRFSVTKEDLCLPSCSCLILAPMPWLARADSYCQPQFSEA